MPSDPILSRTGFILPELLESIGNHLGPSDLFACVQVCRLWNQHLIPQLWRIIDDGLYSWPRILRRITLNAASRGGADGIHWLLDVFAKHGRHIRHLTADWALTIATTTAAGTVTRLESLAVHDAGRHRGLDSVTMFLSLFDKLQLSPVPSVAPGHSLSSLKFVQQFWCLVGQNPSLKSVELAENCQLGHNLYLTKLPAHLNALVALPNLTKLVNNMIAFDLQSLLEHLPSLRYYSCPTDWIQDNNVELRTVFPQLRTLLFHVRRQPSYVHLPPLQHTTISNLLQFLPSLVRFSLNGTRMFTRSNLPLPLVAGPTVSGSNRKRLDNTPTNSIRDFHFTYDHRYSTLSMGDLLTDHVLLRMPLLTKLSLQILPRSTAETLARHCPQLESLKLITNKFDSTESDAITPVLHHCSRLIYLDAIGHKAEATSLVTSPIVCRRLEVLRCQITGIGEEWKEEEEGEGEGDVGDEDQGNAREGENNKDDGDNKGTGSVESKQERSERHHQHIYDELGRLTELRVIELGVDNVDGYDIMMRYPGTYLVDGRLYYQYFGPTLNTLRLSLRSGLDRLKALKKLEVFGFEGVDHRIGTDELTWMAANWPQLRVMHGIQDSDEKDMYALSCPKVKELREHMQKLRPLMRHEPGRFCTTTS